MAILILLQNLNTFYENIELKLIMIKQIMSFKTKNLFLIIKSHLPSTIPQIQDQIA